MGEEDGLPEELEEPCTSFHNSLGELEQCLRLLLNSRLEDTLENVNLFPCRRIYFLVDGFI